MNFDMTKPDANTTCITLRDATVARDELAYYLLQIYSLDPEAARGALNKITSAAIDALEQKTLQLQREKSEGVQPYRLVTNDNYSGLTPRELLEKIGGKGLSYLRAYAMEHKDTMGDKGMAEIGQAYGWYCRQLPDIVGRMRLPVDYADFLQEVCKVYKIPVDPMAMLRKCSETDDVGPLRKAALDVARAVATKNKA